MKFNKKLMAGALAAVLMASSLAIAAPATRNLMAYYGVTLNVNGSNFTVSDDSMRPFTTQDGRVYVSIAALNQMGIVTTNYISGTKTVQIKSAGTASSDLQAQINAQTAENSRLLTENNKLKLELEALKKTSSSSSSSQTGSTKLSDISSSDRRQLERDLNSEIRSMRANSSFERSQRFDGDVSVGSRDVTFNLYPYGADYNKASVEDWNALVANRNQLDRLEDDYEDFMDEVADTVNAILKNYKDFNIYVNIYSSKDQKRS